MSDEKMESELNRLSPQQLVLVFRESKDERVWRKILEKLKGNKEALDAAKFVTKNFRKRMVLDEFR